MVEKKLLIIAALLFAACTSDPVMDGGEGGKAPTAAAQKIVNTSAAAEHGSLIINFNESAIATIEKSTAAALSTRSAVTRSGIGQIDAVLAELGATSLRRVFPYTPKFEERKRAEGLHRWYVVNFDEKADLDAAALKLASFAEVKNIEFNTRMEKATDGKVTPLKAVPSGDMNLSAAAAGSKFSDPYLSRQWHYYNSGDKSITPNARAGADMNALEAWKITGGNPKIIVAVIDEGVKYSHPDLAANMWINQAEKNGAPGIDDDGNGYTDDVYGFNFVSGNATFTWSEQNSEGKGDIGHGTHVAGTVAAVNNNGTGVCGVAGGTGNNDGVRIMSCQTFCGVRSGSGQSTTSAEAIVYAADNGASIIQCSFGSDAGAITSDNSYAQASGVQKTAIDYFVKTKNCDVLDGSLAIFAAGNDSKPMSGYPGAYSKCISVTAIAPDYLPAYYTNYGPGCNVAAPGGDTYISTSGSSADVLSTLPSELYGDDYGYMQGTSMACPHVSGYAALGLAYAMAKGKHYTTEEFKAMLLTAVNDLEPFLEGKKESGISMNLADYRKKMGTGTIDAYQLLMQVEGTPCLKAKVGVKQFIALTQFFGASAANLTYTEVKMSQAEMDKLGITTLPVISYGKLEVKCTKPGVAKISITAIAGGGNVATGSTMGGMAITKEFAIIARAVQAGNGGWM